MEIIQLKFLRKVDLLEFTYIGFQKEEIDIGSKSIINITLNEDLTELKEIVVVGYGTQRKGDITGAVAVVNTDQLKKVILHQ